MASAASETIAVFDLDGTLTVRDSLLPFLTSYALRRRRFRPLALMPFRLTAHACRLIPARSLKQQLLVSFLGNVRAAEVEEHAHWFCRTWVANHLHPGGLERLREHQAAGHRVILLSASPSLYVNHIAQFLGISEVVCTRVRVADGVCSGEILGPNCKGNAKLMLLTEHLQVREPPAESYAYGDHRSDLPVLNWVRHGFLLNRRAFHPVGPQAPRGQGSV